MKKIILKGVCCKGCKKEIENIFSQIYGIKDVVVSPDDCSIAYNGYVSKRVIEQALKGTDYVIERFELEPRN